MKLALGTAQFGLDYGIANTGGKVASEEVHRILRLALKHDIRTLDTAAAYGSSEEVLGKVGVGDFEVITKVPPIPANVGCISTWVEQSIESSLKALRVNTLSAVLLHRPMQLFDEGGEAVYEAIQSFKVQGRIDKIGVSIYQPGELDTLLSHYHFDLVQAPFNLMDRRLLSSGWLGELNRRGIEVHARSVFLQGLLLMRPEDRPAYFRDWENQLACYDSWLAEKNISAVRACLGFACQQTGVHRVVVGVQSAAQLAELIVSVPRSELIIPDALEVEDEELINPAKWSL
ncbi:aldo/keto reductase [Billgrantia antri]|uniref:Aldo/keto reductase n=1 Tax=Billgrantia antri TaxID=2846777 RepID=A0ABS6ZQ43_9GAMM|nr:aldo/keto reductase [Halomonas antri]MBW6392010.1 aldo/keto reductase [Halomonas antri]